MTGVEWLAGRFEEHRGYVWGVAFRLLGSGAEADDAVQECWLRLSRSYGSYEGGIANLRGWLTTVVGRVCLDMLRQRRSRREDSLEGVAGAAPGVVGVALGAGGLGGEGPEERVLLSDSVGEALWVVLEALDPAERLAFVLHDVFGVPFDEVALVVERSPAAARQLASRARRRVRSGGGVSVGGGVSERVVVEAFLLAAREGDFEGLLAVLDPGAVARADGVVVARGGVSVAKGAAGFAALLKSAWLALVDGAVGVVGEQGDGGLRVMVFVVEGGWVRELDVVTDKERVEGMELVRLGPVLSGRGEA
ncbi:sigma-70 family RNA polymerase sigma factor [Streptomyces sp. NA04227]|nr:sigma-70 family RNA polymerase sigma factor [Streptomyces sp. NA04227]QKW05011.1 sigma-70 family RNA polymerase sigma factor [Streptomyces sp. NA04227]